MRIKWIVLILMVGGAAAAEPVREPALREELVARAKKDQDARMALLRFEQRAKWWASEESRKDPKLAEEHRQLGEKMQAVDADDTDWMKRVIDKHGWPGRSLVGQDGAHLAWLLVQHADRDRPFQKKCLELMKKMPKGEVSAQDLAYLTDRVAVGEGKKQVYGTQLTYKDGKLVPEPIEDEANVDRRRADLGLQSLKEYIDFCEKAFREAEPAPKSGK
jgi:hypothetical protein